MFHIFVIVYFVSKYYNINGTVVLICSYEKRRVAERTNEDIFHTTQRERLLLKNLVLLTVGMDLLLKTSMKESEIREKFQQDNIIETDVKVTTSDGMEYIFTFSNLREIEKVSIEHTEE